MTENHISMDKKYQTRDGHDVRLICIDETVEPTYPVIGIIANKDRPFSWTKDGLYYDGEPSAYDLVEVKEEKTLDFGWINIYPNNILGFSYATKEHADEHAEEGRLACVQISVKYKEGDGLTPKKRKSKKISS